jgi:very-short-patch-repair endonuclease
VYTIAGTVASWEQHAWTRILEAGEGAALSHEAAAYVLGLVDDPPARIDVTIPYERSRSGVHRARTFSRSDIKLERGMPVTRVPRTIVDVAGVLPRERLESVVDRALLRGLVSIPSARVYISSHGLRNARGMKTLTAVLNDREGGVPETELERAFEQVLRRFTLPMPSRQIHVGRKRVDFIYEEQRVWIEVNGRRDHGRRAVFEDDHARHNEIALALKDFLHLRFTWTQVTKRRAYVAETVARALTVR